jgi:hypothetical protein
MVAGMSTATATAAHPLSALLHRPPPAAAVPAAPPPRIIVTGTLLEDAVSCTEPATARAAFSVTISQGSGHPAIIATRWCGDGPEAAFHAADRAAALRRGDVVSAHGDGLHMRYRHGTLVLVLGHVRDIELEEGAA